MRFTCLFVAGLSLMIANACSDSDGNGTPEPDISIDKGTPDTAPDVAQPDTAQPDQGTPDVTPYYDFTPTVCAHEVTVVPCTCGNYLIFDINDDGVYESNYPGFSCLTGTVMCCPGGHIPKCE